MLTLIFALAVRLVAHVAGAVAARLSRFLAVSLLGLAAGKMSSLPGGQGKWRNGLMSRQNFGPTGMILGRNRKFSLRFPVGRGKSAPAGVDARRVFAPPPLTRRPPLLPRTQAMRGSTFSVISMKD